MKNDDLKFFLQELMCTDEDCIESNEIELIGEDVSGLSGCCTVKITDIAQAAHDRIEALERALGLIQRQVVSAVSDIL